MGNQIKLSVGGMAEIKQLGINPDLGMPKKLNAKQLKAWVNNSALDDYVKGELIKKIESYPANTMLHFYNNILEHIKRIQADKKQQKEKDKE